jgi:lipopolysaccharide transport system ATP-binding protein
MSAENGGASPAILCVTHYKAGSSWIDTVLRRCAKGRVVIPRADLSQFLEEPVREGKVYPKLYVTKEQFDSVELPDNWRRFVVIRDLRDTMISNYFSLKTTHRETQFSPEVRDFREKLNSSSVTDGLMLTLERWVPTGAAEIQESWVNSGETIYRFEDLLLGDLEPLERILIEDCELPVPRERLQRAMDSASFSELSGGRERGQEDLGSHWRKGVAGDWKNYFTAPLKDAVKERYGQLLIDTGYEKDLDW